MLGELHFFPDAFQFFFLDAFLFFLLLCFGLVFSDGTHNKQFYAILDIFLEGSLILDPWSHKVDLALFNFELLIDGLLQFLEALGCQLCAALGLGVIGNFDFHHIFLIVSLS